MASPASRRMANPREERADRWVHGLGVAAGLIGFLVLMRLAPAQGSGAIDVVIESLCRAAAEGKTARGVAAERGSEAGALLIFRPLAEAVFANRAWRRAERAGRG